MGSADGDAMTAASPPLFEDSEFPPTLATIQGLSDRMSGTVPAHSWRRQAEVWPAEVFPPVGQVPSVVQQSATLGDCWLLSPLAALASGCPSRVREMFAACSKEEVARGLVRVRLCPNGFWREVIIDSLLPCNSYGRPLFAGAAGAGWAALVEKAYAKLLGSYAALEGGRCIEALVDLTGGVCQQVKIEEHPPEAVVALASSLRKWVDCGHILCCTRRGRRDDEDDAAPHVPANHAYAIVGMRKREALLLRDPAAVRASQADDYVEDAERDGPDVDDGRPEPTFSADVWVTLDKFTTLFDKLIVCKLFGEAPPPPAALRLSARSAAGAADDGAVAPAGGGAEAGCYLQHRIHVPAPVSGALPTSATFGANPQWRLRVSAKATVIVGFSQLRARRHVLGLSILRPEADGAAERAWSADEARLIAQAGPELAREIVVRFATEAKSHVLVVPWQYAERREAADAPPEAAFAVRVWCDVPCALQPLPPVHETTMIGEWRMAPKPMRSDGGRWLGLSWAMNPQYVVCATAPCQALLRLERLGRAEPASVSEGLDGGGGEPTGEGGGEAGAGADEPFDPSTTIGFGVLRPAPAASMRTTPAVKVASGLSGNVRDPGSGELLPLRLHASLRLTDEELEDYGIRGKPRPPPKSRPPGRPSRASSARIEEEEAAAAAAAREAAERTPRALVSSDAALIAEHGYTNVKEASGLLSCQVAAPLLVVPSIATSDREGRFRLSVFSDVPVMMRAAAGDAPATTLHLDGEWRAAARPPKGGGGAASRRGGNAASVGSGGGCHLEPTWGANPQYALTVHEDDLAAASGGGRATRLQIALRRPEVAWEGPMREAPVDAMAGLYVLRVDQLGTRLPLRSKAGVQIVHESCFAPTLEVSCTLELGAPRPIHLVLVPTTYGAKQYGPFSLELACDSPLSCELLR